jgi:capsular exopolysaccharide synthesis family protein
MSATLLGGVRFSMISQINKAEFANVRTAGGNKLSWIIFISALVGLVAGFVSIYISEVLDMKFRSIEEVENLIPAPVLGTLTKFSEDDEASYLAFEHGVDGVRTNIELLSMRKNIIVLCLSSIPSEGKTTVALHLARSFANAGKKTLLVDLNLRHQSLSNLLGFINSPGFVDAVTYDMKLDEVVKEIENKFYFLPGGSRHPSPSAFLSHQKVKDFIISLKEKFDYVVLDSSPISAVYDILNIIHLSDFSLLIVGADRVSKVQVKRVSTIINQVKAKIDGVVLNFVDEKVFPYISYYVNKYGYYYYSGSDKTEDKKS